MPKDTLELADTPLAHWLNARMSEWTDPDTGRTGLSQNRLADLSGISQTLVWEMLKKEDTMPKAETLNQLARFFKISPVSLYLMVYLPSGEDLQPEVRAKFAEFETRLQGVPAEEQIRMIEFAIEQMEALKVAARLWPRPQKVAVD